MKTAIAIHHVCFEDLRMLEPLLEARGYAVRYVDATVDALDTLDVVSPDLLVVLGGLIGAFDDELYHFLNGDLSLIRQRLESQSALLGICLGAQLIARVLDALVGGMGVKEVGYAPLTLTPEGENSPLEALEYCIGMATSSRFRRARSGSLAPTSVRIRRSRSVPRCWACNSIWKPTHEASNAGWSDTPASWHWEESTCDRCAPKRTLCRRSSNTRPVWFSRVGSTGRNAAQTGHGHDRRMRRPCARKWCTADFDARALSNARHWLGKGYPKEHSA